MLRLSGISPESRPTYLSWSSGDGSSLSTNPRGSPKYGTIEGERIGAQGMSLDAEPRLLGSLVAVYKPTRVRGAGVTQCG